MEPGMIQSVGKREVALGASHDAELASLAALFENRYGGPLLNDGCCLTQTFTASFLSTKFSST
jgi:hypothetical protein